jgi:hypothetical protein
MHYRFADEIKPPIARARLMLACVEAPRVDLAPEAGS